VPCKGFHFGSFDVNLEGHELRKSGIRIRLSEQPFHALILLLERQGGVVTRDELRKALWPGQNWGDLDHRLNKTINQIREALGDSANNPRFLETLPRIGYRFLVPVRPLAMSEQPQPPPQQPAAPTIDSRPNGRFRGWALAAAAALSGAMGFAIPTAYRTLSKKAAGSMSLPAATPLTTYLGSELYPSFSPDGSQVVFAWDGEAQAPFHLFAISVNSGALRQLTGSPRRDYAPVWSPDGRSIAFLRESEGGRAEVRTIQADGLQERKLTELVPASTDHPLTWTKDSRWLIIAANPPSDGPPALFRFSAVSGEMHRLTSPPMQSGGDFSPAVSPGGSRLAFTRSTSTAWRDIFMVPLSEDVAPTHDPIRITDLHRMVDTIAWSPDGQSIYFSAAETLAGARSLFRVNAGSELNAGLIETGIEGSQPSVSSATGELVYVRSNIDQTSIWQVKAASGSPSARPRWQRLMASTRRAFTADISPDGRLVFSSARSGPTEIWLSNLAGSGLRRITSLGATPRWSPDGRRIVYESTADGQSEIYVIDLDSGSRLRLTNDPGADIYPSWSRDGKSIYFCSDRSGKPQIWKVPSGGGKAVQITRGGGRYAVESFDGRTIYYTTPQQPASIRLAPSNGGPEVDLIDGVVGLSSIAIAPDGLFYLSSLNSAGAKLDFYEFASRTRRRVATIDHPLHHVLSSSPDGRSVLFTQIDRQDSDLMLLKLK
jgi:Tol biopolymer transport system component/DNA-binding winged helix-turn-helix (wHTH) protein